MSSAEGPPAVEVQYVPRHARKARAYCQGKKHPSAYQRDILVTCGDPLFGHREVSTGLCNQCFRRAEKHAHRDDAPSKLALLKEHVNLRMKETLRDIAEATKESREASELLEKTKKRRHVIEEILKTTPDLDIKEKV